MTTNKELSAELQRSLATARAELMVLPQSPAIELFLINEDFPPYQLLEQRSGTTLPDLDEFDEFREVRIYTADRNTA